ncbi:MAG: hypothetical protein ACO3CQ_00095 [Candidatus Nanopelagicaceae bacterium]
MGKQSDRDSNYMREMWGTTKLVTDYQEKSLLREVDYEKNRKNLNKFKTQNEIHEKIRNDDDYDDWEYGTEPLFG